MYRELALLGYAGLEKLDLGNPSQIRLPYPRDDPSSNDNRSWRWSLPKACLATCCRNTSYTVMICSYPRRFIR